MLSAELKELLDFKHEQYNIPAFIENDPISIPHMFSVKEDIEIAGFLTATIAWGQRTTIIKNAKEMFERMDWAPYDFIKNHSIGDLRAFATFKHRTFNSADCNFFIESLRNIYLNYNGLENIFTTPGRDINLYKNLSVFREVFFSLPYESRTLKHVSNVEQGSAGKRLNMFLRWMVRNDKKGVDFGIWKTISPANLYLPLDVHTANASRKLGLLTRKNNDWKAVFEVTRNLRLLDPNDPIKYDFALFGLSRYENI
jgi:uncharacterized protein (TIGR02757 family)